MRIDADGSPHAYKPGGGALDFLANAGKPGNWYGIVCNSAGEPVVQGANDPAPGYYISPSALSDKTKKLTDPRRYVDSEVVPYIAIPPEMKTEHGVRLGDLCVVGYRETWSPALVADIGPRGKHGEGSIALAKALEIPPSPRNGGVDRGVVYVIFPGTAKGWPRPGFEAEASTALLAWGGPLKILSVPL